MSIHLRTHRQVDWRKLNIEPHNRPRRMHSRDIYGPLVPMEEREHPGWMMLALFALVAFGLPVVMNWR